MVLWFLILYNTLMDLLTIPPVLGSHTPNTLPLSPPNPSPYPSPHPNQRPDRTPDLFFFNFQYNFNSWYTSTHPTPSTLPYIPRLDPPPRKKTQKKQQQKKTLFCIFTITSIWGLDSAVVNALACHPGSNPGVGMWQGSGLPSKVGGFPRVLRFPPPHMTTERQHPRLREVTDATAKSMMPQLSH